MDVEYGTKIHTMNAGKDKFYAITENNGEYSVKLSNGETLTHENKYALFPRDEWRVYWHLLDRIVFFERTLRPEYIPQAITERDEIFEYIVGNGYQGDYQISYFLRNGYGTTFSYVDNPVMVEIIAAVNGHDSEVRACLDGWRWEPVK